MFTRRTKLVLPQLRRWQRAWGKSVGKIGVNSSFSSESVSQISSRLDIVELAVRLDAEWQVQLRKNRWKNRCRFIFPFGDCCRHGLSALRGRAAPGSAFAALLRTGFAGLRIASRGNV
jgi:hypothetical protein